MYLFMFWKVEATDVQASAKWLIGVSSVEEIKITFLYSFGFSILSLHGTRLRNRWIQFFSTLFVMVTACGLLGRFLINSRTLICTSLTPLCPCCEKCLPIDFSCLELLMSPKWLVNLARSLSKVCPTYCRPHLLHEIDKIQEIFFMHWCIICVGVHLIVPVLLGRGQKMQSHWPQGSSSCGLWWMGMWLNR